MANFKGHVTWGLIGSMVGTMFFAHYQSEDLFFRLILMMGVILIGSILPDIDDHKSTPAKIAYAGLSVLLMGGVLLAGTQDMIRSYAERFLQVEIAPILHYGLLLTSCLGIYILTNHYLPRLLAKWTYHRGIIHSLPMGILLGQLFTYLLRLLQHDKYMANVLGYALFFGFFLHLLLDELCSLDLTRMKPKKSFGTAMTLYSFQNIWGYLGLYALILVFHFGPEAINRW